MKPAALIFFGLATCAAAHAATEPDFGPSVIIFDPSIDRKAVQEK